MSPITEGMGFGNKIILEGFGIQTSASLTFKRQAVARSVILGAATPARQVTADFPPGRRLAGLGGLITHAQVSIEDQLEIESLDKQVSINE